MTIADLQKRYRELGRIRLGEKTTRGNPKKLETFRLTSTSEELLRHASGRYGGIPKPWKGAPTEAPQYELLTESDELEVLVPPQNVAGKQLLELYNRGGVVRRCDGEVELMSGKACLCDPDARECDPTTHVLFILPDLPDLGVWRLTTHGWNAATELPTTVGLLLNVAGPGALAAATLALETRTSVAKGKTRHYPVPVLRVPYSLAQLEAGGVAAFGGHGEKPPIGEQPALPGDASFVESPNLGEAPALPPGDRDADDDTAAEAPEEGGPPPGTDPDNEWTQAWDLLVQVCDGSLSRAATYVNKACKTSYTQKTLGDATLEQLNAGIEAADR